MYKSTSLWGDYSVFDIHFLHPVSKKTKQNQKKNGNDQKFYRTSSFHVYIHPYTPVYPLPPPPLSTQANVT